MIRALGASLVAFAVAVAAPRVAGAQPVSVAVPCTERWGWFLEATSWAGVGLSEDREGVLRNAGGAVYRPCGEISIRAGLVLSLWATSDDPDQQHGVFGLYRVGPEIEVDLVRIGATRLGVAARIDAAFGRAHEGGADLAIHGGVRFRYHGLVLGADVSHGIATPGSFRYGGDTTVVLGIGQSGHAPYLGFLLEVVAFGIAVNLIHRN